MEAMLATDWILIGTAFFLGVCALLAPYFAEIIKRKALAPRLEIFFELTPPFCHKTIWRPLPGSAVRIEEPVYYFRCLVKNKGKTQARLCEVVLENLWIYNSAGSPKVYPNFSPVNMHWSGTTAEFININPDRRVFCNLGYISSEKYQKEVEQERFFDIPGYGGSDLRFRLDLVRSFHSQPNCFPPGRYIIEVGLYSENAACQKKFFDISWSGNWQDGVSEMFREIVIAPTKSPI